MRLPLSSGLLAVGSLWTAVSATPDNGFQVGRHAPKIAPKMFIVSMVSDIASL